MFLPRVVLDGAVCNTEAIARKFYYYITTKSPKSKIISNDFSQALIPNGCSILGNRPFVMPLIVSQEWQRQWTHERQQKKRSPDAWRFSSDMPPHGGVVTVQNTLCSKQCNGGNKSIKWSSPMHSPSPCLAPKWNIFNSGTVCWDNIYKRPVGEQLVLGGKKFLHAEQDGN